MPQTNIGSTQVTDFTNAIADFSVDSQVTDAQGEQKETLWVNDRWSEELGYYKEIPELRAVIDAKATWSVGKGFITDEETTLILNSIKGWGKDTFNTIIENMIRTYYIGGDAFAEIIRDEEGNLINLKPLDTGTMQIVVDKKGLITKYNQLAKAGDKKPQRSFKKEDIFHLARNRVADEIHGQSLIDPLTDTILRINEAKSDWRRVLHRNVEPMHIFHVDSDDTTKITNFKTDWENARKKGENMIVPKDIIVPELVATATNASLNPLSWIESETDRFYEAAGVPKIIVGGIGGVTEAAVKIAYLAFQQNIEEEQLFIEEQVGLQLGIRIELEFPASLENELLSDKAKDTSSTGAAQPSDTTAGANS